MSAPGLALLSGMLQPGLAGYAWRLHRCFGIRRVGWWIAAVFLCLALLHLVHALPILGLSLGFIDLLISVLLLVGMAHTENFYAGRLRLEHKEKKQQAELQRIANERDDVLAANQNLLQQLLRREQRERNLNTSEKQLRRVFDENPLPMWIFDLRSLRFLAVNQAALRLYGYTARELTARTAKDLCAAEDFPAFQQACAKPSSGPDSATLWRHRGKNGALLHVEIRAIDLLYDECPARLVVAQAAG